eukprot:m.74382 g.74382  ORF g.74382 m.74382 type:complete len:602 (-) comp13085_c0_seq2:31-1836(-)
MPLLGTTVWTPTPPPSDLSQHTLVWTIRFTHECFVSYEDYSAQLELYRRREWTCSKTGRSNLTLEECLLSERVATHKSTTLPELYIPLILSLTQFSPKKAADLVTEINAHLKLHLLPGESNICLRVGSRESVPVRVLAELPNGQFEVQVLHDGHHDTVTRSQLYRREIPFTRDELKRFILSSTTRQDGMYVLNSELAAIYNIPVDPPEHVLKRLSHRFPLPDEELQPEDRQDEGPRPVATGTFDIAPTLLPDVFFIWDFVVTFEKQLLITPFSLFTFILALNSDPGALLHSLCCSLPNGIDLPVAKEDESQDSAATPQPEPADPFQRCLVHAAANGLLSADIELPVDMERLDAAARVAVLKSLVEMVLESSVVRGHVDALVEDLGELRRLKRDESLEYAKRRRLALECESGVQSEASSESESGSEDDSATRRKSKGGETKRTKPAPGSWRKKDGEYFAYKARIAEFDDQIRRTNTLRREALGMDRDGRGYWLFAGDPGVLFVQEANDGEWSYFTNPEEVEQLQQWLNAKGARERSLLNTLGHYSSDLVDAMQKRLAEIKRNSRASTEQPPPSARGSSTRKRKPAESRFRDDMYTNKYAPKS